MPRKPTSKPEATSNSFATQMQAKFQSEATSSPFATQMQAKFQQALAHHQGGQIAQAYALYQDILTVLPDNYITLYLLGIISLQSKGYQQAVDLFDQVIALQPDFAEAYYDRGNALKELNQLDAAVASYDQAITLKSDFAKAYVNRGHALKDLNQLAAAVASYDQAIAVRPDFAGGYFNRGNVLKDLEQLDAALASYDQAIALRPDFAEAYSNRGTVLKELSQPDAALASYDQAIVLRPDYAEAYFNRGITFEDRKQLDAALASYDQAIVLRPDYAEAYNNRGIVLKELSQLDAALVSYDQAIALRPDYAEAYSNRGIVLNELSQPEAALASYDQAIALKPDYAEAYFNRGNVYRDLKQFDAAVTSFDRAIGLKPDFAEAYWNKSLTLLITGDFDQGWGLYEWRWERDFPTSPKRNFQQPLWLGNDTLVGKTILLHAEQGLGDAIQFSRYASLVADLGAHVIMEVGKPLLGLFKGLAGVSRLIVEGSPLPGFDYHCPLLSLPLAFKTDLDSIPFPQQYLHIDASKLAQWAQTLGEKTRPRVGLVWSGSTTHKNDHNRSIPLSSLIPQLPPDYQYVSLQKDVRNSDKPILEASTDILHFGDELRDFSDTAALCELMDVVISVDTSVAHLSGALGRPTWVLLPYIPDWRWLMDRDDSPWYARMKLYRQDTAGDWDGVFARVRADLPKMHSQSLGL